MSWGDKVILAKLLQISYIEVITAESGNISLGLLKFKCLQRRV